MIVIHRVDGTHEDWWDATVADVVPAGAGGVPAEVGPLLRLHDTRTPSALVPVDMVARWHEGPCTPDPGGCTVPAEGGDT